MIPSFSKTSNISALPVSWKSFRNTRKITLTSVIVRVHHPSLGPDETNHFDSTHNTFDNPSCLKGSRYSSVASSSFNCRRAKYWCWWLDATARQMNRVL
ncbi:hypothetical protein E6O75_ATG10756 [Venturia nashicola]|uniref:Uncharacterized protein n=1 Tax=Venturia nashicola TaxID=86259 RepID=A0A4Z1P072_9PEZI|nr:hypothetical protein E6O75_ATG10756 [Venturia nashicola]